MTHPESGDIEGLSRLAELLRQRNALDDAIARLIGRPALTGHIGEYLASRIFNIRLSESATTKAIDGYFASGPLEGRSVNIKIYEMLEGILDIRPDALPDCYLVLTGPRSPALSSRGKSRVFCVRGVYLFRAAEVVQDLTQRGRSVGVAASVRRSLWDAAEVFPRQTCNLLPLTDQQRAMLELFACDPGNLAAPSPQ